MVPHPRNRGGGWGGGSLVPPQAGILTPPRKSPQRAVRPNKFRQDQYSGTFHPQARRAIKAYCHVFPKKQRVAGGVGDAQGWYNMLQSHVQCIVHHRVQKQSTNQNTPQGTTQRLKQCRTQVRQIGGKMHGTMRSFFWASRVDSSEHRGKGNKIRRNI